MVCVSSGPITVGHHQALRHEFLPTRFGEEPLLISRVLPVALTFTLCSKIMAKPIRTKPMALAAVVFSITATSGRALGCAEARAADPEAVTALTSCSNPTQR